MAYNADRSVELVSEMVHRMVRPETDQYFLVMAQLAATRATCARRRVGCVLVNEFNHVLSTGYNGVAAGMSHCHDNPCPGATQKPGEGLHLCQAIHAEQNALMQCRDITAIRTAYVTASPCILCVRMLLGTSCQRVVFVNEYPHKEAEQIWRKAGRAWVHNPLT